ncbi:MAG: hypothetical protein E6093_18390 [Serratia liquefaciens]|nr:hypothetical protein [Serratia liquefaciens]
MAAEILKHKDIQGIHHISKRTAKNITALPESITQALEIASKTIMHGCADLRIQKLPKKEALLYSGFLPKTEDLS